MYVSCVGVLDAGAWREKRGPQGIELGGGGGEKKCQTNRYPIIMNKQCPIIPEIGIHMDLFNIKYHHFFQIVKLFTIKLQNL